MPQKIDTHQFIENAHKIHGTKYDYTKCHYYNAHSKITITCAKHGDFDITPNSHLNGSGCYDCGRIVTTSSRMKQARDRFISNAIKVHGKKYDYTEVEYNGYNDRIKIICLQHGLFTQTPRKHLAGNSCKKCRDSTLFLDVNDYINRVNIVHDNKYTYLFTDYTGIYNNIIVTCAIHGNYNISATSHLHKKMGCKKCVNRTISKPESAWLDSLNIEKHKRNIYMKIGHKTLCVDAYDESNKTVYEFNGDFFHGNPAVHNADEINPLTKESFGSLHTKTLEKEKMIIEAGYKLVSIWEKDFKNK